MISYRKSLPFVLRRVAVINEDRKMRKLAVALNNEEIMNRIMVNGCPDD